MKVGGKTDQHYIWILLSHLLQSQHLNYVANFLLEL